MVGVPGRSGACLTCKKRRIACDLQKPECGQCTRSRRDCCFDHGRVFVLNEKNSHKTIYRKEANVVQSRKARNKAQNHNTASSADAKISAQSTTLVQRTPPLVAPFGAFTALQQQLFAHAVASNGFDSSGQLIPANWALTVPAFTQSHRLRTSSALACYAAWIGRHEDDSVLVEASRKLYVQALGEIQQAVNDPEEAFLDQTLAACMALITYEALECPDQCINAYSKHVEGCSRLIKLRGASMHQDGPAHQMFQVFRYIEATEAISKRRPSYLAFTAWRTLPWRKHPKTMYDRLTDFLHDGPALLQKGRELAELPPHQQLTGVLDLVEEISAAELQLTRSYDDFQNESPGPLFWETSVSPQPVNSSSFELDPIAAKVLPQLHFCDALTGQSLMLYWALLAMVRSSLADLFSELGEIFTGNESSIEMLRVKSTVTEETMDWLDPCRKLCRSVEFATAQSQLVRLALPLGIVIEVMRNRNGCAVELMTAQAARNALGNNLVRLLRYVDSDGSTTKAK